MLLHLVRLADGVVDLMAAARAKLGNAHARYPVEDVRSSAPAKR